MKNKILSRDREELIFTPLGIIDTGADSLRKSFLKINQKTLTAVERITAENNVKGNEPLTLFLNSKNEVCGISLIPLLRTRGDIE
jgi:dihydroxyacetone kinase